jgi:hypothetical protein
MRKSQMNHARSTADTSIYRVLASLLCSLLLGAVLSACASIGGSDPFSKSVTPRLQNGEPERRGPVINEAAFNNGAQATTLAPYTGFVGTMRVSYEGNRS